MKPREKPVHEESENKRQTRFCYSEGPIYYVGQQIVRAMQDAGYPAKVHCCYRSPEQQQEMVRRGVSKAGPYKSPHQYKLAVDIIHATQGWNVSDDFWDTLNACVQVVGDRLSIPLEHGYDWGWDSAHIELKPYRTLVNVLRVRSLTAQEPMAPPTQADLDGWFQTYLPRVWANRPQR